MTYSMLTHFEVAWMEAKKVFMKLRKSVTKILGVFTVIFVNCKTVNVRG